MTETTDHQTHAVTPLTAPYELSAGDRVEVSYYLVGDDLTTSPRHRTGEVTELLGDDDEPAGAVLSMKHRGAWRLTDGEVEIAQGDAWIYHGTLVGLDVYDEPAGVGA